MNLIHYHDKIISNYRNYIQSFLNIKDPKITSFVEREINDKKLWPEPLVQFNPTFEKGNPISKLVDDGHLHSELGKIFSGYSLYKHQEEAILLGSDGKEFIVTSGTGSGKSLTYIATIFNKVLQMGALAQNKVQAVIVYPMNALINSQFKEIEKFKKKYEESHGSSFPVTFGQYTGQETEAERDLLRTTPPNIVLTNYMMLELILTRGGKDIDIRESILENIQFLVFDELHTYRGRQGSDVSMLIRRIKSGAKNKKVVCIGTSATMVSSDDSTLLEQREKVAEIASTIFGTDIHSNQVVNEYLIKSLSVDNVPTIANLQSATSEAIDIDAPASEFEKHPTAKWIEEEIALEKREGKWVRRKPVQITSIAETLALSTGVPIKDCIAVTGDDKEVCKELKKANAAFNKTKQSNLFDQGDAAHDTHAFSDEYHELDDIQQDDVAAVTKAKQKFDHLRNDAQWYKEWRACNLWTAAFFYTYTEESKQAAPGSERLQKFLQNPAAAYGPMWARQMPCKPSINSSTGRWSFPMYGSRVALM